MPLRCHSLAAELLNAREEPAVQLKELRAELRELGLGNAVLAAAAVAKGEASAQRPVSPQQAARQRLGWPDMAAVLQVPCHPDPQ